MEALKWRLKQEEWEEKAEVRAQREALKWRQKEEEWEEKEAHLKEEVEALQIALTEVTGLICIHIFGEGFKIKNDHLQP